MKRVLIISSDCHAGPPPPGYRPYLDPQYRDAYDQSLPQMLKIIEERQKKTLAEEFLASWKQGHVAEGLRGVFDSATDKNSCPFGAGLAMPTEGVVPELQWAGARAHNRWIAEFCAQAPERRAGLAAVPIFWDVDEAVREIHWAKDHGLRGILIPALMGDKAQASPLQLPQRMAKAKSVIFLFMEGGPSHLDLFDPKPALNRLAGQAACRSRSTPAKG